MTRQLLLSCLCGAALALVVSATARADDLPIRKAGLWEMKIAKPGAQGELTMQHCTDETTDKDMNNSVSPMAKQLCSKQDIKKTATGYTIDSVCSIAGITTTSHSDVAGDYNSAYSVTTQSHSEGGPASLRDVATKVDAKWLGACKTDQKPGDIVMPGGFKLNVKDAEKLKGLLPKSN
jgi:Protein of unknown function (DUF3617)